MQLKPGTAYSATIKETNKLGYQVLIKEPNEEIFMPKELADTGLLKGDRLTVYTFHNQDKELQATTIKPKVLAGELATLKVVSMNPSGAWLDWGLPLHLFMPRTFHEADLLEGDFCLVKAIYDEPTNKLIAKEKIDDELSNEILTVKEKELVNCIVYRDTPIGYQVIINEKHLGLLHYNEVFKSLYVGDVFKGFVKKIKEDHKIDIMLGKPGYSRVDDEKNIIIKKLEQAGGFLPYHDKSAAEDIYNVFEMSKKTFKMTIGTLYKMKKITIEENGIRLNQTKSV
ncbi:MAG: S1-like domain-containing RNA-binding protein [Bacteroidia bacterium]|jgi:hypothetical protein|nr:S1-like domain-containing RNA-binding protein [Bacteroidia bacterium]